MLVMSPIRLMREPTTTNMKTESRNGNTSIKCVQSLMTFSTGRREVLTDSSKRFTSSAKIQGNVPFGEEELNS